MREEIYKYLDNDKMMCLLAMKAQCEAKHSVVIESQLSSNHLGVHVVVCIEKYDELCITNGSWLVVLGDEPHLSLFPRLWHPHMSLFPNHHKSTHHSRSDLVPELYLEAIND